MSICKICEKESIQNLCVECQKYVDSILNYSEKNKQIADEILFDLIKHNKIQKKIIEDLMNKNIDIGGIRLSKNFIEKEQQLDKQFIHETNEQKYIKEIEQRKDALC